MTLALSFVSKDYLKVSTLNRTSLPKYDYLSKLLLRPINQSWQRLIDRDEQKKEV